jgi:hypothetical protein
MNSNICMRTFSSAAPQRPPHVEVRFRTEPTQAYTVLRGLGRSRIRTRECWTSALAATIEPTHLTGTYLIKHPTDNKRRNDSQRKTTEQC